MTSLRNNSPKAISSMLGLLFALLLATCIFCPLPPGRPQSAQASALTLAQAQTQGPAIILTTTVGTVAGECATSDTVVVPINQTVYTCYQVSNSGSISFTRHTLSSSPYGPSFVDRELPVISLEPGATLIHTEQQIITETRSFTANWTALNATLSSTTPVTARASDTINITVQRPAVALTYTVGLAATECAATSSLSLNAGSLAAFCVQIGNSGLVTLSQHSLTIPSLGISTTIVSELAPRQVLTLSESNRSNFGISNEMLMRNITMPITSTISLVSQTALGDNVRTTGTATISVGLTKIKVDQSVSTDTNNCAAVDTTALPVGTTIYLCVSLTNIGNIPVTQHGLTLQQSGATVRFSFPLTPSQTISLTNNTLTNQFRQSAILGPFTLASLLDLSTIYTGTTADGVSVSTLNGSVVGVATPTSTRTVTPTATGTVTPILTETATPSMTPGPTGTPTPTPVVPDTPTNTPLPPTPIPTPTRSFAISFLATPTLPVPTPDFNATNIALATVQAAQIQSGVPADPVSATAVALQTQFFLAPEVAQATAIAMATQQAINTDPVLATAVALQTQFLLAPEVAQATAVAMATQQAIITDPALATSIAFQTEQAIAANPALATAIAIQTQQLLPPELAIATAYAMQTVQADPVLATAAAIQTQQFLPAEVALATSYMLATEQANALNLTAQAATTLQPAATDTLTIVVEVANATPIPVPLEAPPPTIRPIMAPTLLPALDALSVFGAVAGRVITVAGWVWFLLGSLVFFTAAGVMAGVVLRYRDDERFTDFDLIVAEEIDDDEEIDESFSIKPPSKATRKPTPKADDWPDSLP